MVSSPIFFPIKRGVRQGCPLFPYLFIICMELLTNQIRINKNIKGITIAGCELKDTCYADDASFILDGSRQSFDVVSMVMSFCAVLFPRGVLDEILNLIESVSGEFPSYF